MTYLFNSHGNEHSSPMRKVHIKTSVLNFDSNEMYIFSTPINVLMDFIVNCKCPNTAGLATQLLQDSVLWDAICCCGINGTSVHPKSKKNKASFY